MPFIIEDEYKMFYYRGLATWAQEHGYLLEACPAIQEHFKALLDYFRISYDA